MFSLDRALGAWGTADFERVLKQELAQKAAQLPLQQAMAIGNHVVDAPITVMINRVEDAGNIIRAKAGIFYQSLTLGCSCADDPTPNSENNEYCEVQLDIDKSTAATAVMLASE